MTECDRWSIYARLYSTARRAVRCQTMRSGAAIWLTFFSAMALSSCGKPEETVSEVANGDFKVVIRSQEFHHSGIRNLDICVAETSEHKFPRDKARCFLHGFDFSELSVKWRSQREIEVYFRSGRVARFTNSAFVSPTGSIPVEFHTVLCDGCGTGPT